MSEQELRMTSARAVAIPPETYEDAGAAETLETRFGKITIYRKNPIVFPNGLLGMPDKFEYCLTNFPSPKLSRFKVLQSLEDNELAFITLPLEVENNIIEKADIDEACANLDISPNNLTMLLIVTVYRAGDNVRMSVNARAPIFINTTKRVATQYVFHNNKYDIQHMITL